MKVAMSITVPIEYASKVNELVNDQEVNANSRSKLVINALDCYFEKMGIPLPKVEE